MGRENLEAIMARETIEVIMGRATLEVAKQILAEGKVWESLETRVANIRVKGIRRETTQEILIERDRLRYQRKW